MWRDPPKSNIVLYKKYNDLISTFSLFQMIFNCANYMKILKIFPVFLELSLVI